MKINALRLVVTLGAMLLLASAVQAGTLSPSFTDFEEAGFVVAESVHNHMPDGNEAVPEISFGNACVQAWFVPGSGTRDEEIVDVSGDFPDHGKVWRFSNGHDDGLEGQQPHSANSGQVHGESGAANDAGCGAVTTADFYAELDFRSATGASQPGYAISFIANSGDTRHGYARIIDDGTGFDLLFFETGNGCEFPSTAIDLNLSYTDWHTVGLEIFFVDGLAAGTADAAGAEGNDIVNVYINHNLVHTGTSWESCVGARSVDRLLFEHSSVNPANLDGGVYVDNVLVTETCPEGHCLADDEGPLTSDVTIVPNPIAVNANGTVTANVDDSTTGGSTIASAEYSLDGGAWTSMDASDGSFDEVSDDVNAPITAPEEAGIYDLCVRGTDEPGNTGAEECAMLVVYDPDGGFVTGGGWIESPEGSINVPVIVWDQGFESDTGGWFDGTSGWNGTILRVASGTSGIGSSAGNSHAIVEGDSATGPFSRFDGYRDTWTGSWTAEIDVYLDIAWASGTGFDYSVAANGSDGNHQRDYIFHVTKDTSTGSLLVAGSNNTNFAPREDLENINHYEVTSSGWYTLQHLFREQSGALAVDLNLLDANGNVLFTETRLNAADTIPAEVGGNRYAWFTFINVGGGIAVDNHQLILSTSPSGKANFGFVAKYKKGANVPDGNTEFVFKAADLNFHSTSYDWLVVTGNDSANFKGEGTINGANAPDGNPYKFKIWAHDGNPDTFRIKIWWEDGNSEVVVYDNGANQPIGGGNIVVHNK